MAKSRRPGERAGLTKDEVVRAAVTMLDQTGDEGLTMRGLADRLGVRANTLYSYTASKLALIDDVLDHVLADVESPEPDDDPVAALRRTMRSTYNVLHTHQKLVPLYVKQQGAHGPNAQRLGDAMIEILQGAGIKGARAVEARHVLIVYTIGSAAYRTGTPMTTDASASAVDASESQAFLRGLEWLIRGIGV